MAASSLYSEDHYIVLETDRPETLLDAAELAAKLTTLLQQQPDLIPDDLRSQSSEDQVRSLLNTVCELDMGIGQYLQWYAVRLEK
jgi:hypothetical protein